MPVINFVAFEPCDEEVPDELPVGATINSCLTYLASAGQTIDSVLFLNDLSADPITWS